MKILVIGATGMLAQPIIEKMDSNSFTLRLFSRTIDNSYAKGKFEVSKGNLFNEKELEAAIQGCDAIHINLAKIDEFQAVKAIISCALQNDIKLISYLSGCTVSEENRWFPMIDNKFKAEQEIISSGIPYLIFRPTWFLESLPLMVRKGKAVVFGKQPNMFRWVAAADYARMVVNAYKLSNVRNKIFFIYGNESITMKDALQKYCRRICPDIQSVTSMPIGAAKLLALVLGKKDLKHAATLFSYFENAKELHNSDETDKILGEPEMNIDDWLTACAQNR